jgi:hypothetical protein
MIKKEVRKMAEKKGACGCGCTLKQDADKAAKKGNEKAKDGKESK